MLEVNRIKVICEDYMKGKKSNNEAMWDIVEIVLLFIEGQMKGQ